MEFELFENLPVRYMTPSRLGEGTDAISESRERHIDAFRFLQTLSLRFSPIQSLHRTRHQENQDLHRESESISQLYLLKHDAQGQIIKKNRIFSLRDEEKQIPFVQFRARKHCNKTIEIYDLKEKAKGKKDHVVPFSNHVLL